MKTLTIAKYTIIRSFRDYKTLSIMVLFPIVLILILGTALDSAFKVEKLDSFDVAYINEDQGIMNQNLGSFFTSKEIKDIIHLKSNLSYTEAKKLLKVGKIKAILYVTKNYSKNLLNGKKAAIEIISRDSQDTNILVLKNIINSFNSMANSQYALAKVKPIIQQESNQPASDVKLNNYIAEQSLTAKGHVPRSIDYYSVTMLVLIIMYGSLLAIYGFSEDYLDELQSRMLSTPVSLFSHFVGKITGVFLSVFIQSMIVICFTKFVFQANWGDNYLQILMIILSLSFFVTSLGVMTVMIFKNKGVAASVVQIIIPIMTFISGGYMKFELDNNIFNKIKFILPSSLGQTAFFNSIYNNYSTQYASTIGLMWIYAILALIIALVFGRRKLA